MDIRYKIGIDNSSDKTSKTSILYCLFDNFGISYSIYLKYGLFYHIPFCLANLFNIFHIAIAFLRDLNIRRNNQSRLIRDRYFHKFLNLLPSLLCYLYRVLHY